ncbi:exonuclease domain-containing protein [Bosea vestrisii]|uniref:exonuclease domain-containing protein n=1 Tax=Bosea vestrisii TaxID=151416 RepID=UPI0024DF8FA5|nr:exonuclease domain-containing protein [Bosea vestrisii]WID95167.1 exonuclease domain-containing protein [Bosea vestrisii]
MTGFVFFDTETTGLRKGFDQIVHFAAIRTDHELNEIDRFEARSRLQPHVVPHPKALLTNGLPIAALLDPNLPSHYAMTCAIARKIAEWSPAIFVGYNSIAFDEEMLRHGFFQSLHDPYPTSRPGNGRADALALALAAFALPPHCLAAPEGIGGRRSFKLADIAPANGLHHTSAHNALADVEVTLELCRLVRAKADDVWQRFQRFSNKSVVSQFVETEDGFVLTEFFGGGQAVHRPVVLIGRPPGNPNGRFCLDLSIDPDRLGSMSDEEMIVEICRKGTPVRRLAVNGGPALTELWAAPEELLGGLDLDTAENRARRVKSDPNLCARIVAVYTGSWSEREPSPLPELRLYDGFPCDADKQRMQAFHEASRQERLEIIARFEDPRLAVFGRRLLHAEHRGSLSETERRQADLDLADRLLDDRGGPLTLPEAVKEIDAIAATDQHMTSALLNDYRRWLVSKIERVERFRTAPSDCV